MYIKVLIQYLSSLSLVNLVYLAWVTKCLSLRQRPKAQIRNRTRRSKEELTRKLLGAQAGKPKSEKNYLRTNSQRIIKASCVTTIM